MGLTKKKVEGDLKTPRGSFNFRYLMYRSDRISNIQTKLKKIKIKKNFGWCDDPSSNDYNKLITFLSEQPSKILFSIFVFLSLFFYSLTISEIFEDYMSNEKIKNVANKLVFIFAILLSLGTIITIYNL